MTSVIDEIDSWYIRRAYHNQRQAQTFFTLHNYVESIITSYEAIEFSAKAMCKLLDVKFGRRHFINAKILSILGEKIERKGIGEKRDVYQVIPAILSYSEELRNISRYGIEEKGVPSVAPMAIFRREYAESVVKDAKTLCDLLRKIEIKARWKPKVKIGILDGFVTGEQEVKCPNYPFTNNDPEFWKKKIKAINKFEVEEIRAVDINERFGIILNPFGEEYPEIDIKSRSVFFLIKDYVKDGGVYINTAGFPFFYAWDVKEGKEYPICDRVIILPRKFKTVEEGVPAVEMQKYLDFTGTLLFKEFNAIPTPVSKPRQIFQRKEDIDKFGDLTTSIGEIDEFRALPKNIECIPIVRAKDEISGEIFPISALKHGAGYLLFAGLNTEKDNEADLFVKAVEGFSNWITKHV